MANAIKVTPEELLSMVSKLEGWTDQYSACYTNIYNTVSDLTGTWGGEAQMQYSNQIEGFRNDFDNLYMLFNKYATYLRQTAQRYQDAENDIKAKAAQLNTGI